jgi:3-deoxy-manno-octulosonate cytidylyltransferase (CMP-KDO synthetase)
MFHIVIPARFAATRLPGKPLIPIGGRPLIQWVWERARASGAVSVTIATDDARIHAVALGFGADCLMTSDSHASGTDRIAEVVRRRAWGSGEIVVNVQGDEPLIEPSLPAAIARVLAEHPDLDIATAVAPVRSREEFLDPNCVKAVRAADGSALYFSRAPVPWPRDSASGSAPGSFEGAWWHIGIYGYRVRSLLAFADMPPSPLERIEKLEQLRALEAGMRIHLLELAHPPAAGVDTPQDLERVRAMIAKARGANESQ